MNLLIHDLSKEEFESISADYAGWEIISDNGKIKPCVGCFGCWIKDPGECVIKDGYHRMGELIHKADEVVVISKYTYGGFSSFVKNVFDRSISWVLPFFEIYEKEMHHQKRYPEEKKLKFIFRGNDLSDEDKEKATEYVKAVCRNFRSKITDIVFEECEETPNAKPAAKSLERLASEKQTNVEDEVLLINFSLRNEKANTRMILNNVAKNLDGKPECVNLSKYLNNQDGLVSKIKRARRIVLGFPLYVDGIPSAALRILEQVEALSKMTPLEPKKVYVVANMGLYESIQLHNLLSMAESWCGAVGVSYCGGLAVGAGEMIGPMLKGKDIGKGPTKDVAFGIYRLCEAINNAHAIDDIYVGPSKFPRKLYMFCANIGWPADAKRNGLSKADIYRKK